MHTRITYARSLLLLGVLLLTLSARGQFAAAQPSAATPPTSEATATAAVATAHDPITHEENARVPEGAAWTQHYFPSSDGSEVELHADVLLPEALAEGEKAPVILSVGAYFGHSGEMAVEDWEHTGPSDRYNDLIEGADLFDRGYALVMVDLRGFGGSTGCLDFMGPGEQADVQAAIDWAANQPWSTGAVGMYGKSYDAITGLVGNNLDQDALKAVVAQEPIWDLYRNIWSNGVPQSTIVDVSRTYNEIATLPQLPDDDERYRTNAAYEQANPLCLWLNSIGYQDADPASEYWQFRNLAERAKGSDTPLFFTQGFLEWNTEAEAMEDFLANHEGSQRGWLGQWDHVRGNDHIADGRLAMGREGWFEEVMSFYDQYLKGIEPTVSYPAYAIQDSTGAWPIVDRAVSISLGGGSYLDNGVVADPAVQASNSFFVWSEPVEQPTRITGTPRVTLEAEGHGNVLVELYDVAPDGSAVMFDRQAAVVKPGTISFDLRSTDWMLPAGHTLAVEIGTIMPGFALDNDWIDTPSNTTITISAAQLDLAFDDPGNDAPTSGSPAPWLETYRLGYTEQLSPGAPSFTLPMGDR
ncbi:MAG: CocE/NonD family hydrolase [Chloroflexi bacterium AL-W]|nr:CocE/NonD family hydrolase [Chloroflexi bacterium AL-N1]NOK66439.1 CocE/NonD family hydrolase [Chloroflexi bacterium AL-N10]NOK71827.1 CocE/NonD family hydrolase [Chloroflexi bacterium AL-N5]NOK81084.1 CocE/NonD family hydrolase [Chloroflexi bacterium AL-W]NOK89357.1 CocE/NonD family hydrolase [Chloroflexi bacterium AL-N15]